MRPSERPEEYLVRILHRMYAARGSYAALVRDLGLPATYLSTLHVVLAGKRPLPDRLARTLGWRRVGAGGQLKRADRPLRFVPLDPAPLFDVEGED
jgi:hypothetical protein